MTPWSSVTSPSTSPVYARSAVRAASWDVSDVYAAGVRPRPARRTSPCRGVGPPRAAAGRALHLPDDDELGIPREQPGDERPGAVPGTGVDDQPGLLVHHDEVGILEDDADVDVGLGDEDVLADGGQCRLEVLARLEGDRPLLRDAPVHEHVALHHQLVRVGSRQPGEHRDRTVDAHAVEKRRHLDV